MRSTLLSLILLVLGATACSAVWGFDDLSTRADVQPDGGCDDECAGKCGQHKSRCGEIVDCGGCNVGETCGAGGIANVCGVGACTGSCAGKACGDSDGCASVCVEGGCGTGQRCVAGTCTC